MSRAKMCVVIVECITQKQQILNHPSHFNPTLWVLCWFRLCLCAAKGTNTKLQSLKESLSAQFSSALFLAEPSVILHRPHCCHRGAWRELVKWNCCLVSCGAAAAAARQEERLLAGIPKGSCIFPHKSKSRMNFKTHNLRHFQCFNTPECEFVPLGLDLLISPSSFYILF